MLFKKTISTLMISLAAATFVTSASAAVITFSDRSSFEATITNKITDGFNTDSFNIFTSAQMKALSTGSIGYESTGFVAPDWNIVSGNALCWGCNGSGQIVLDDTTIGSANGVFGLGVDITSNNENLPYDAFVTFGDGSTQNFDLGSGAAFFGLTSTDLIKTVHFGLTNGVATTNGSFQVDNVTIGNAAELNLNAPKVPEPASIALFGLGLLGLGFARKRR